MWDYVDFVVHCLENMTPEQIVLGVANVLLAGAGYFGVRVTKKAAVSAGSLALLACGALGWCFKRGEDSPAFGAAMGALEDEGAIYEGGSLAAGALAVEFYGEDYEPRGVRKVLANGGTGDLCALLSRGERKRFEKKALSRASSVIAAQRAADNAELAAAIRGAGAKPAGPEDFVVKWEG